MTPKTARLTSWDGPLPELGHALETKAGSVYVVLHVRPNTRAQRKSLAFMHLGKLSPTEIEELPADTVRHGFAWDSRDPTGSKDLEIRK